MNTLNLYTKSILDLYNTDERRGDFLLTPQRWCNRNWNLLLFDPRDNSNAISQAAERIIKIALLIIPTVISYGIGVVGAMVKLCSNHPKPLNNNQSNELNIVPPIPQDQNESNDSTIVINPTTNTKISLKPSPPKSFLDLIDPFDNQKITLTISLKERVNLDPIQDNQDVLVHIVSYLTPKEWVKPHFPEKL